MIDLQKDIERRTDLGFMVRLDAFMADLEKVRKVMGNTCVYIRNGGVSCGAVALNRFDADAAPSIESDNAVEDLNQRERIAAALWGQYYPNGGTIYKTYEALPEKHKEHYREYAAAVQAAL